MNSPARPHSEEQFGPQRDHWWNPDFLDLMARRWRLQEASSLADIGCGLCHWSSLLYPYLRSPATFAGVDREVRWMGEAERRFRSAFPDADPARTTFRQGDATRIPLPDDAFDVVTCQTVLMHLAQPLDALAEMVRITRPGGLIVCVEPSNLWNHLPFTSNTLEEPTEALVRRFEFWLRCHRGRIAAERGDHNIGDLLPGLFAQLGLRDMTVHQSDRVAALFPPYDTPAQRTLLEQERQWKVDGTGPFDREELRRLFDAGGGAAGSFDRAFRELIDHHERWERAVAAGTFHAAYGGITYLVSGRKH